MAPRRVAAALTSDDTLEDSIRQDLLGARGADDQGGDDQQQDDGAEDQGGDDQQQDDGAEDQGDDQQQDDGAEDQGGDDQQQEPAPRRRAATRRDERDDDYVSPAAQRRIDEANRIATETQARLAAFEARFSEPSAEQEAARLATMTPEEQTTYRVNKALAGHSRTIAQATFNAQNSSDRVAFDGLVRDNPQLKRFAADVERKHTAMVQEAARTGAGVPTRDTVLKYLLGEKALELAQKAAPQARARTQRVERQRARPGQTRSDVSTTRRRETTAEQRLEHAAL